MQQQPFLQYISVKNDDTLSHDILRYEARPDGRVITENDTELWPLYYYRCQADSYLPSTNSDFNQHEPLSFTNPTHLYFPKSKNVELRRMRMLNQDHLAGYNSFRGDFEKEYDDNAEQIICLAATLHGVEKDIGKTPKECEEQKLLAELQLTLADTYNSRLEERGKRKCIVNRFGLLNRKGFNQWHAKMQNSIGKTNTKKLLRYSSVISNKRMEYLLYTLQYMYEKRAQLNKLVFYRSQYGVSTKIGLTLAENHNKENCKIARVEIRNLITPSTLRRNKAPFEIFHLPRFKELTTQEADLCSLNNLHPEFFLATKDQLVSDCTKQDGMLLKRARKLVKIDVNKTRKIYDFLIEQGQIWPPSKS